MIICMIPNFTVIYHCCPACEAGWLKHQYLTIAGQVLELLALLNAVSGRGLFDKLQCMAHAAHHHERYHIKCDEFSAQDTYI